MEERSRSEKSLQKSSSWTRRPGIVAKLRRAVSKKKKRYVSGDYDLDLTYITPQIIAMGFPSQGVEKYYRNPLETVQSFLTEKHPEKYKLYNLCKEKDRTYDEKLFEGRVNRYPWYDHSVPPLGMMRYFCQDMDKWLNSDKDKVAAVHCKAGKGRTGLAICCYLIWSRQCVSYEEALRFFGDRRASNGKGITINSQKRFLMYFARLVQDQNKTRICPPVISSPEDSEADEDDMSDELDDSEDFTLSEEAKKIVVRLQILEEWPVKRSKKKPAEVIDASWNVKNREEKGSPLEEPGRLPPKKPMVITSVIIHNGPKRKAGFNPLLQIKCGAKFWDSRDWQKPLAYDAIPYEGFRAMVLKVPNIPVEDETYVSVLIKKLSANKKKEIAAAWIHTSFANDGSVYLVKKNLDCVVRRSKKIPDDFALEIKMKPASDLEGKKTFTNMII